MLYCGLYECVNTSDYKASIIATQKNRPERAAEAADDDVISSNSITLSVTLNAGDQSRGVLLSPRSAAISPAKVVLLLLLLLLLLYHDDDTVIVRVFRFVYDQCGTAHRGLHT